MLPVLNMAQLKMSINTLLEEYLCADIDTLSADEVIDRLGGIMNDLEVLPDDISAGVSFLLSYGRFPPELYTPQFITYLVSQTADIKATTYHHLANDLTLMKFVDPLQAEELLMCLFREEAYINNAGLDLFLQWYNK